MEHKKGDRLPIEIAAKRLDWQEGVSLFARKVTFGVSTSYAQLVTFEKPARDQENSLTADPFLTLTIHEAQKLIDELWQCGLRPSEGTGSAGSLAATERHLEDMKKIAFNCLDI